jgi:DNA-directed RNA polymerase subunit RPC12/RpoP
MSVTIPQDADGRIARECPNTECSPAYFKVTPGTGITGGQEHAYCPYCRHEAEPTDFTTQEQIRYAKDIAIQEARSGIDDMVKDALGLGPSGNKKLGGGFISIEMSYKPSTPEHVRRPFEDEVRRDVVCPHCTLDQTVFGLATWCSDCGRDIFLAHVAAEISVTRSMLRDIDRREHELGKRVAAKDLENCLEDAVSIFEASAKALIRRALNHRGDEAESVDAQMKKLGNSFQSIERAKEQLSKLFGYSPAQPDVWENLERSFEKRHPVTHNLGVVDKKYLERVQQAEREGREVRISEPEVNCLLDGIFQVISEMHRNFFGGEK